MADIIKAQPWLPKILIDTFDTWETKGWKMWEYGSGFSTSWFAQRVEHLWSMEHDNNWHCAAKRACEKKGLSEKTTLMLEDLKGDYTSKICSFPKGFFDCVLIDGRRRVDTFLAALPKTSKVIILDNALRPKYSSVIRHMKTKENEWVGWKAKWTEPVIRDGGKEIPVKDSWHSIVWVRKGTKLK